MNIFTSVFASRKTKAPDLSFLGADMHAHLLPGLDDGLQTLDQTLAFIRELQAMGHTVEMLTPLELRPPPFHLIISSTCSARG